MSKNAASSKWPAAQHRPLPTLTQPLPLLPAADWRGVGADLCTPGWLDALRAAGFNPRQPTVWLAEGVLMYVPPAAVDAVLRAAAGAQPR